MGVRTDSPIQSIAFSSDGEFIATGDDSGALLIRAVNWRTHRRSADAEKPDPRSRVVDLAFGPPETLLFTGRAIHALAFTADDSCILAGCDDGALLSVARSDQTVRPIFQHHKRVLGVSCSGRGQRIALCGGGTAVVLDAATGDELARIPASSSFGYVGSVALSSDGDLVAVGEGGFQPKLLVWRIDTHEWVFELKGHPYSIWDAAFSSDGGRLVSRSLAGYSHSGALVDPAEVRVWDIQRGACSDSFNGTCDVRSLALGPAHYPGLP